MTTAQPIGDHPMPTSTNCWPRPLLGELALVEELMTMTTWYPTLRIDLDDEHWLTVEPPSPANQNHRIYYSWLDDSYEGEGDDAYLGYLAPDPTEPSTWRAYEPGGRLIDAASDYVNGIGVVYRAHLGQGSQ